ncbi:zinc finger protein 185 (LIM domain), partial [Chelydra serpentina]
APEMCHQYRVPEYLDDTNSHLTRSSSQSRDMPAHPTDANFTASGYLGDTECDRKRSSPSSGDSSTVSREVQYKIPVQLDDEEFDFNRLPSASSERISMSTASSQYHSPSAMGHKSNPSTASKGILFVKEYVNSCELSPTPRYSSDSLVDLSDIERASYLHSSASQRSCEGVCTYCGREIRDCPKIMIEHLNVYCHEYCFRCGICHKAMGDLLDK